MKSIAMALFFGLALVAGAGGSARLSLAAPAQIQPNTPQWDALWRKCRTAVFRKYGERDRVRKRLLLPSDRAVAMTDACVANGGRVL